MGELRRRSWCQPLANRWQVQSGYPNRILVQTILSVNQNATDRRVSLEDVEFATLEWVAGTNGRTQLKQSPDNPGRFTREEVRTAAKDVSELRSEKVVEKTRQKIAATPTGAEPPNIVTAAAAFLEELPPIVGKVSAGQRVDGGVFFDRAAKLRDKAKVARQEADSLIGSLQKQGRERERELAERSTKLRDLEDRLVLKELLPLLRKHVEKARWAQRAETIIRERFLLFFVLSQRSPKWPRKTFSIKTSNVCSERNARRSERLLSVSSFRDGVASLPGASHSQPIIV